MKVLMLLLAGAIALCAADPKAEVLAAMETWKKAVLARDGAALGKLLHPDLTYSHSNGRTETRADVLKTLPDSEAISFGETSVRVYGKMALVKGPMDIQSKTAKLQLSVLQVWMKGATGWQMVARQSTRLNP